MKQRLISPAGLTREHEGRGEETSADRREEKKGWRERARRTGGRAADADWRDWAGSEGLAGDEKKRSPAPDSTLQDGTSRKTAASYSPAGHRSTIGADGLNFSVRDGKRWNPDAIATII